LSSDATQNQDVRIPFRISIFLSISGWLVSNSGIALHRKSCACRVSHRRVSAIQSPRRTIRECSLHGRASTDCRDRFSGDARSCVGMPGSRYSRNTLWIPSGFIFPKRQKEPAVAASEGFSVPGSAGPGGRGVRRSIGSDRFRGLQGTAFFFGRDRFKHPADEYSRPVPRGSVVSRRGIRRGGSRSRPDRGANSSTEAKSRLFEPPEVKPFFGALPSF